MVRKKKVKAEVETVHENIEELIIQALIEKKGVDIISIDLKKMNHVFFDYFIICTGNSKTHVETLSDFVQETTIKLGRTKPMFIEGTSNGEWILLDYFNVIVHIFQPEIREYYNIEKLWRDAPIQKF
ncbi:MAG: ribosome silencing factor [Bacteroidales bacterium]|jgi:ribosome-associated protein|nr:ribosome silencing factor [Bacteroidales bacterium]